MQFESLCLINNQYVALLGKYLLGVLKQETFLPNVEPLDTKSREFGPFLRFFIDAV